MEILQSEKVLEAVPELVDLASVGGSVWSRIRACVAEPEVMEVYRRIGPVCIDDGELLLNELVSLAEILADYRRETEAVAQQRAEAHKLCIRPEQALLRRQLRDALVSAGANRDWGMDDVASYCLAAPLATRSAINGRTSADPATPSSIASIDTRPTSSSGSTSCAPMSPTGSCVAMAEQLDPLLPHISLRSAESTRRFDAVLPELQRLMAEEAEQLKQCIEQLHQLLRHEMHTNATVAPPSNEQLCGLRDRIKQGELLRRLPAADAKRGEVPIPGRPISPPGVLQNEFAAAGESPTQSGSVGPHSPVQSPLQSPPLRPRRLQPIAAARAHAARRFAEDAPSAAVEKAKRADAAQAWIAATISGKPPPIPAPVPSSGRGGVAERWDILIDLDSEDDV